MPERHGKQNTVLTEKIDELESLLAPDPDQNQADVKTAIPILDELVDAEDYDDALAAFDDTADTDADIEGLAERLEQKFYSELDEIVNILKANLKQNIRHELHEQLKHDPPGDKDD